MMYSIVTRAYITILRVCWRLLENKGHAVAQVVKTLRYKPEGRGFNRPHYGPGVDLATNRNAAGAEG
jgi:hypothetical protein